MVDFMMMAETLQHNMQDLNRLEEWKNKGKLAEDKDYEDWKKARCVQCGS